MKVKFDYRRALYVRRRSFSRRLAERDALLNKGIQASDKIGGLIDNCNQDIARTRSELISFLAALAFVAVTTFSITDKALLIGSRATLPLLNVMVGLNEFLIGSPFLAVAVHFALLLKFDKLREKCREIDRRLDELQRQGETEAAMAHNLSLLVGTNFLAQWLIGSKQNVLYKHLNSAIYAMALIIAPVFVLLLIVIRTLPLHQETATAVQMAIFFVDVWFIAYFHSLFRMRAATASAIASALWFSTSLLLCVPDGYFDQLGASIWPVHVPFVGDYDQPERLAFAPTAYLLENALDEATHRPIFLFSRNLIVEDDRTLIDGANSDAVNFSKQSPEKLKRAQVDVSDNVTLSLRGRNLRYAVLDRSDLRGTDLTLADLSGASLRNANLKAVTFGCAAELTRPLDLLWLRLTQSSDSGRWVDTKPRCTQLNNTRFDGADLRGARFVEFNQARPSLNSAIFSRAILDGVDLSLTDLSGATLIEASLVGVNFSGAKLIGTDLSGANLTGANLYYADLTLSGLSGAILDAANLSRARLIATELTRASLIGAELAGANLMGSRLVKARVWETSQPQKQDLTWADLTELLERRPDEREKKQLMASIARLIDNGTAPSLDIQNLQKALEAPEEDQDGASEKPWKEWAQFLARSNNDPEYRRAIAALFEDIACQFPQYAVAVGRWLRTESGGYVDTYSPSKIPKAPPDPAIDKVKEASNQRSIYPDVIVYPDVPIYNALPDWVDLGPLDSALETRDCEASKQLSVSFLKQLHSDIVARAGRLAVPKSN
jgi:uncharacterized protein YjbI with pentapeptide repeats